MQEHKDFWDKNAGRYDPLYAKGSGGRMTRCMN